ncbi:hypothetical protein BHS09_11155 [Myxococcus xanthus]|uniref:Uncharacterized protein n=2 Tax=Myxococcus xanthus TaxID=34 RepID=A0AAE6FYC2_MYXXA|nr:hypothetical protein BHS09_11155 [Myxococcus xanthus]QDE74773.1 hypothetical protein BHS08_11170 [Myxococcus xanthus]
MQASKHACIHPRCLLVFFDSPTFPCTPARGVGAGASMSLIRRPFAWSAALLLTFATVAAADPISSEPEELCENSASTESSLAICFQSFCDEDWQCANACPSAQTATCVNSVCEYTYRTGGGTGGPGGPFCPTMLCADDYHCQCGDRQGYCSFDSICYF